MIAAFFFTVIMRRDNLMVRGKLIVRNAATVLCVRQKASVGGRTIISRKDLMDCPVADSFLGSAERDAFEFKSSFEVLMGQSEVINWMKSTPEKLVTMRYAGEWKVPGGEVDESETLRQAALRELSEELGTPVPSNTVLRPLCAFQTRPVRSKSHLMHTFVALEEENPWIRALSTALLNKKLEEKRKRFKVLAESGEVFAMTHEEREKHSPEVHRVEW